MILVVGSTGLVGRDICRRLAAKGLPVRALVRETSDPTKVAELERLGLEIVRGDVRDPASLARACSSVDAVISTVSSMPFAYQAGVNDIATTDCDGSIRLIETARQAGVRKFIYTSFSGNIDPAFPLRDAKRRVEAHLRASGLDWTILRPSYFMEVWLSPAGGFDAAASTATIYGNGTNPISWISLTDVAAFAVASLDNDAARNATLELGGAEAVSPLGVVGLFERAGGRAFAVQHVPVEALETQQAAATDPMQQSFTALMRCYAAGDPIDMSAVLRAFPLSLTSVADYAMKVTTANAAPAGASA